MNPQVVNTRLFCQVLSGEDTKSPIPHPQYTNYYFPLQYQTLARRLLPARSRDSVSFSEINSLISAHMAGLLLPSNIISGEEGEEVTSQLIELDQVRTKMLQCLQYFNTSCNLLEFLQNSHKLSRFIIQAPVACWQNILTVLDQVVEHLVPHPGYKLLTTRMMPVVSDYCREFTNTSWEMLGQ